MRPVIYISGPITKGDREHNFRQAAEAQEALMYAGFSPINPMLTMAHPNAWEIHHDLWLACDLEIVERSDAVLRLPGISVGADEECEHAVQCDIPVFNCPDTLENYFVENGDIHGS